MTTRCSNNGHETYFRDNEWFYTDSDSPVDRNPRPCKKCGATKDVHPDENDKCIGFLPGVVDACCGHGDPKYAYVHFQNGVVIRGFDLCKPMKADSVPLWIINPEAIED